MNYAEERQKTQDLLKKVADIETRARGQNRDLFEYEASLVKEMKSEAERIRLSLPAGDRVSFQGFGGGERSRSSELGGFRSIGEFFQSVARAGQPSGQVDQRLLNIQAAASGLNETVPSEGGFVLGQDFSNELLQDVYKTGILASRCRRIQISGNSNSILMNAFDETSRASTRFGGVVGYWEEEAAEKTASKPKFRQMNLTLKKLIGLCYATDELLQDQSALGEFIRTAFISEFGFLLDDAIINGTGAGQPLGILNAGCLVTVDKEVGQKASTLVAENCIKMYSRLLPEAEKNSVWLINRTIIPQLYTMSISVGLGGIPIYMPAGGMSGLPYNSLFGRPVVAIEQAAPLGTVGDIILADLPGGYILAEKGGIQADMSIHVRFVYDESCFRFVLRIDGQPVRATALTPYKGGASYTQSNFVALATRSV